MNLTHRVNPDVLRVRATSGLQCLARRITDEIRQGKKKPFQNVMDLSSGDPQGAGMAPLTFVRQVLAVCVYPDLLTDASLPVDVRNRARTLLQACSGGSVGAYSTTSRGFPNVLRSVSEFITRRDGVPSHADDIIFSRPHKTLEMVLHLFAAGTGVLVPLPWPHTVPALVETCGLTLVPYPLREARGWASEARGWALDVEDVRQALQRARETCDTRAMYVSNPGNPTGHVQDRTSIKEVIRFAAEEGLVLLADEEYQDSVYGAETEFLSYKKVLSEMDERYSHSVELVSFHSISSSCMAECGLRGGYLETVNLDPDVIRHLKQMQATASPPVLPQLALELMVNPPTQGQASYQTHTQEILHIGTTLSQNALRACEFLNAVPGLSCDWSDGGIFLFPRLQLPTQIIEQAKTECVEPDVFYCQKLLEQEGVLLGPGSDNGLLLGPHYHLRMCVLAPTEALDQVLTRLGSFHHRLLETFHQ